MHRLAVRLDDERMLALANYVVLPVDPSGQGQSLDLAGAPLLALIRQLGGVVSNRNFLMILDCEQYVANTCRIIVFASTLGCISLENKLIIG